jgi:predicted dehydrogenase
MVNIGVIGYGYWGPNIVRNFKAIEKATVSIVCDIDREALKRIQKFYSDVKTVSDPNEVLTSPVIDAVAIVTPVFTHFELAKKALENGKHIFVGKPFTSRVSEAEELIELAERNNLMIMVDHTFLFTGAVKKIKEIIDDNLLGQLYYYDSTRVNLGLFQHDVNVIWDLAPHDLSIMDYLLEEEPVAIVATGSEHFGRGLEDVAYLTVYFNNNLISHFNVNWLSPVKIRSTLIGGEKKMLVWNDLEQDEKIKVYDKGVEVKTKGGLYNLLIDYRSGDMWSPLVDLTEALKVETEYFVDCILNNENPINDGCSGLRVVKILEASNKSLKEKGKLVEL